MNARFLPGDRVAAESFGAGTVVEEMAGLGPAILSVRWDNPPPMEYCIGKNPCLVLAEWLRKEETDAL